MEVNNRGVILFKKEGQIIPQDFLEHMVGFYPTTSGYIVQMNDEKGEGILDVGTSEGEKHVEIGDLMEMQKELQENPVYFFFSKLPASTPAQNHQPFILKDDNNDPWAAVMLEGNFPGHANEKDKTEEFVLFETQLKEHIEDYLDSVGMDLTKLHEKINAGRFEKLFERELSHRGVCLLVIAGHDGIIMGKNELSEQYDWGWSTQTLGYGEVKAQEPVPAVQTPAKASRFARRVQASDAKPAEKPAETAPAEEKKDPPGVHRIGEPQAKTSVPQVNAKILELQKQVKEGDTIVTVPLHMNNGERKLFIRQKLGLVKNEPIPFDKRDWLKKDFAFIVRAQRPVIAKSFEEAKEAMTNKTVTAASTVKDAATKVETPKGEIQKQLEVASAPKSSGILSDKEAKELTEWVLGYLDATEKANLSPFDIQKGEKRYKSFTQESGATLLDLYRMPTAKMHELIITKPNAALMLMVEFRKELMLRDEGTLKDLVNTKPVEAAPTEPVKKVANSRFSRRG